MNCSRRKTLEHLFDSNDWVSYHGTDVDGEPIVVLNELESFIEETLHSVFSVTLPSTADCLHELGWLPERCYDIVHSCTHSTCDKCGRAGMVTAVDPRFGDLYDAGDHGMWCADCVLANLGDYIEQFKNEPGKSAEYSKGLTPVDLDSIGYTQVRTMSSGSPELDDGDVPSTLSRLRAFDAGCTFLMIRDPMHYDEVELWVKNVTVGHLGELIEYARSRRTTVLAAEANIGKCACADKMYEIKLFARHVKRAVEDTFTEMFDAADLGVDMRTLTSEISKPGQPTAIRLDGDLSGLMEMWPESSDMCTKYIRITSSPYPEFPARILGPGTIQKRLDAGEDPVELSIEKYKRFANYVASKHFEKYAELELRSRVEFVGSSRCPLCITYDCDVCPLNTCNPVGPWRSYCYKTDDNAWGRMYRAIAAGPINDVKTFRIELHRKINDMIDALERCKHD